MNHSQEATNDRRAISGGFYHHTMLTALSRSLMVALMVFFIVPSAAFSNQYRSIASDNWNKNTTWQKTTNRGTTWLAANSQPGNAATDTVWIQNGNNVIMNAGPKIALLTVGQGTSGSLVFSGKHTLTVSASVSILSGASIIGATAGAAESATFLIGDDFSNQGTFNGISGQTDVDVTLNGAGDQIISGSGSFSMKNVIVNKSGGTVFINAPMAIGAGFTETLGNTTLGANLAITGNLTVTLGTFDCSSFTANRTASGGTLKVGKNAVLRIGGTNSLPNNYTFSFDAASTEEFYGNAQSVPTATYGNLLFSGAGTRTLTGNAVIAGDLTVAGGLLDLSTFTANRTAAGGILTLASGATLRIGGTTGGPAGSNFPNNYSTRTLDPMSTVEYDAGNGTTQIIFASPVYGNLSLLNGSPSGNATKSATAGLAVAGNLFIGNLATFQPGAFTDQVGGNWVDNGIFTPSLGTITMNGSIAQTIGGNVPTTFYNLTAANTSGGVSILQSATVAGLLTLGSTSFSVGSNLLTLTGPPIAGTISSLSTTGSSSLSFGGTSTGVFIPSGVTALNTLTIDNAQGITLNGNVTVQGVLRLLNGVLTTGARSLSIGAAGRVERTSGHVAGHLQKYAAAGSPSLFFEIGDASDYRPVAIDFGAVTNPGQLTASVLQTSGQHPNIATSAVDPSKTLTRYWTLSNSGIAFDHYSATFTFVPGDIPSGANSANFVINAYNGATWTQPGMGTLTATSTQATGLTSFSDFVVGESKFFSITSSAGENGSISPPGTATFNSHDNAAYAIVPAFGYHVADVLVDGISVGSQMTYAFTDITTGHTIVASFALNTYSLTVDAVNGVVTKDPDAPQYDTAAVVALTATANTGYHFVDWSGDIAGNVNPVSVTMTGNKTISANFSIDSFTIVATTDGNGTITPGGTFQAAYDSTVVFTIAPNAGYHVDSLFIDGIGQGGGESYSFEHITGGHAIHATFMPDSFIITAVAGENGTITPSGEVKVGFGKNQIVTITPNIGCYIDSVIVDGAFIGTMPADTFYNVVGNHTIRATFKTHTFTITTGAGPHGSISPGGSFPVNYGADQVVTIIPNTGYHIADVTVDGISIGAVSSDTLKNVMADHAISATFAIDSFTVVAGAGVNGSIEPEGSFTVAYDSSLTFVITPLTGYHVDSLTVDGVSRAGMEQYSFEHIAANHTLFATFKRNTYTITAVAGAHGTVTPAGATTVEYGASQIYAITPNTGYYIDSVIVDGVSIGKVAADTFTNVTANHTIRAKFKIYTFTITVHAEPNGTITPSGPAIVDYGTNKVFTITPGIGYHIVDVLVDDVSIGAVAADTFKNVTADHSISATFAIDTYVITASAGPHGSIDPSGTMALNYGDTQGFVITPDNGYAIDSLLVDESPASLTGSYTFTGVTASHSIRAAFRMLEAYQATYRTFTYDSLIVAKASKKKPVSARWKFGFVYTGETPATEVTITFKNDVTALLSVNGGFTAAGSKKGWVLSGGALNKGDSLLIVGRSAKAKQQIAKLWYGAATGKAPVVAVLPQWQIGELPMPNAASIRDLAFQLGGLKSNPLTVGIKNPAAGFMKTHGAVALKKSSDMLKSLYEKGLKHLDTGHGFKYIEAKPFAKVQSSLSPLKHNDKTFADLLTLKFNILLSRLRVTPVGFGELRLNKPGNPWHGMLLSDIAHRGDSMMTYHENFSEDLLYARFDSLLCLLNSAFSGCVDTLSWADSLKLTGTVRLFDQPLFIPSGIAPVTISKLNGGDRVLSDVNGDLPEEVTLEQNYPNPFNPTTSIRFGLPDEATVSLKVFNTLGQEVATLLDRENLAGGMQEVQFDAQQLPSGVYFYRIMAELHSTVDLSDDETPVIGQNRGRMITISKKMILVK